jgi:hypothetical protein
MKIGTFGTFEHAYYKTRTLLISKLNGDCFTIISEFLDYFMRYNMTPFEARMIHYTMQQSINDFFHNRLVFFYDIYIDEDDKNTWLQTGYHSLDNSIQTQYIICLKCGKYNKIYLNNTRKMRKHACCKCV